MSETRAEWKARTFMARYAANAVPAVESMRSGACRMVVKEPKVRTPDERMWAFWEAFRAGPREPRILVRPETPAACERMVGTASYFRWYLNSMWLHT
jgi:hypothetical protein